MIHRTRKLTPITAVMSYSTVLVLLEPALLTRVELDRKSVV